MCLILWIPSLLVNSEVIVCFVVEQTVNGILVQEKKSGVIETGVKTEVK